MLKKKNSQAIAQLQCWFDTVKIPHEVEPGCTYDFVVQSKNGILFPLVVLADDDARAVEEGVIAIKASVVTGRDIAKAVDAFRNITVTLGYGALTPVDRGALPTDAKTGRPKNLSFKDNFELVALRHKELRRAPNPAPGALDKYKPLLERACWSFLRSQRGWPTNAQLCSQMGGLDHDDLMTYALLYATTFHALYELRDATDDENKALLTKYVKQKFSQLRNVLVRKMRSTAVDSDAAQIGTYGDVYTADQRREGPHRVQEAARSLDITQAVLELNPEISIEQAEDLTDHLIDVFEPVVPGTEIEDLSLRRSRERSIAQLDEAGSPETRQSIAKTLLQKKLSSMGHDEMLEALDVAVHSRGLGLATRKMAAEMFAQHTSTCTKCRHIPTSGQSAPKRDLPWSKLSPNEQAVVGVLLSYGNLRVRAIVTHANLLNPQGDPTSPVRNALRRLVQGSWVTKATTGLYGVSDKARTEAHVGVAVLPAQKTGREAVHGIDARGSSEAA